MLVCFDIGNTHIYGGVFNPQISFKFRYPSKNPTSDELGIFLRSFFLQNNIDPQQITKTAICSVVPLCEQILTEALKKYFNQTPLVLNKVAQTKLKAYRSIGADRVANILGAKAKYPNNDLIIVDMGTATTIDVLNKNYEYLGGMIFPGINIQANVVSKNTANLPNINIIEPKTILGNTTEENIQAGLYYNQLGAISFSCKKISDDYNMAPIIIGTGGNSYLFKNTNIFDLIDEDLVLLGLKSYIDSQNLLAT